MQIGKCKRSNGNRHKTEKERPWVGILVAFWVAHRHIPLDFSDDTPVDRGDICPEKAKTRAETPFRLGMSVMRA
jgi:hypothetical protein